LTTVGYLAFALLPALVRCAVLTRLVSANLLGRYRWFAAYIASGILQNAAWLFGPSTSPAYGLWWTHVAPLVIACAIMAAIELWCLTMSHYSRVSVIYHWLIPAVIGASLFFIALGTIDLWLLDWRATIYRLSSLAVRYSATALAVFCGFLMCWALLFPRQLRRNVRIHGVILTANFATLAVGYTVTVIDGGRNLIVGRVMTFITSALLAAWALVISPEGESVPPPAPPSTPDDLERLASRERELLSAARPTKSRRL
jgi:hypothetical protein